MHNFPLVPFKILRRFTSLALLSLPLAACSPQAPSSTLTDAIQTCAGCHGENGVPADKTIPVIWGQNRNYLWNQLRDIKTGRRKNEIMAGIVEPLSMSDLQQLAWHFSKLGWPDLKQTATGADEKAAFEAIDSKNCQVCHLERFQGTSVVPRLAGQQIEYLDKTMQDFRSGQRSNSTVMSGVMRDQDDEAMKALANYLGPYSTQPSVATK